MFDFDESSNFMQVEKCIHFVRAYLERCKHESASHELVFVLYGRLYYPQVERRSVLLGKLREALANPDLSEAEIDKMYAFKVSHHTKVFQDVFLKVGSPITLDSVQKVQVEKLLTDLKQEIQKFPALVNWQINAPGCVRDMLRFENSTHWNKSQQYLLPCELGTSEKSNLLEAINLTLF